MTVAEPVDTPPFTLVSVNDVQGSEHSDYQQNIAFVITTPCPKKHVTTTCLKKHFIHQRVAILCYGGWLFLFFKIDFIDCYWYFTSVFKVIL